MSEKYHFLSAAGDITEVLKLDFGYVKYIPFIDSDNNSVSQSLEAFLVLLKCER